MNIAWVPIRISDISLAEGINFVRKIRNSGRGNSIVFPKVRNSFTFISLSIAGRLRFNLISVLLSNTNDPIYKQGQGLQKLRNSCKIIQPVDYRTVISPVLSGPSGHFLSLLGDCAI